MFERIKQGILRDMQTASESRFADGPRDALVHNFLLVEACGRLNELSKIVEETSLSNTVDLESLHRRFDRILGNAQPELHRLQEDQHDSIMIAFFVDQATATSLALPGGEDLEELHCTLCYLGKVNEFTGDLEQLKEAVTQCASMTTPLQGNIGGIGRFTPSEHSDNLAPVIALVNIPGLQEFRRTLAANIISLTGAMVTNDFDFLPHITLAYIDSDAPMSAQNIEALPLSFDTLWLCIGDQRLPYKLGAHHEPTNPQSPATEQNSTEITYQEESRGEAGSLPEDSGIPSSDHRGKTDTNTADSATNANTRETSAYLSANDSSTHFKSALADIATKEILAYKAGQDFSGHLENGIAQLYLEAQRYAYNKAMTTVGIKVAQEGIVGRIASGIKTSFDQALNWAKEQVGSIASTLQEALRNFLNGLSPDLSAADIDAEVSAFLETYAGWKAPQVANTTWGTGADLGTNAAIDDILEAATNPDLPGLVIDNMRVRVLPETSSSDYCADYAGQDYSLEDYDSLGISWPAHPGCPHYADLYIDTGLNGSEGGDEEL